MKRFRAEAAMAAALQHPNIVAIHELVPRTGDPNELTEGKIRDYEAALDAFVSGKWNVTSDLLRRLPNDGPSDFLRGVMTSHNNTPPENWNGTIAMSSKSPASLTDVRKTLSPQTTGEAPAGPGSSTFHATFFVGLQSTGRFFSELRPFPFGPRQLGQLSASAGSESDSTANDSTK